MLTLRLNDRQARVLSIVVASVGGSCKGPRGATDQISNMLKEHGVDWLDNRELSVGGGLELREHWEDPKPKKKVKSKVEEKSR